MPNEPIIIQSPDMTGVQCRDCTEVSAIEGGFECRKYDQETSNAWMQKSIQGFDFYQAGLVGDTVEKGQGSMYIDTLKSGRFTLMGRNNGGKQNGRYSCFFNPQKLNQGTSKWAKVIAPEHLYIHVEGCPAALLDTVALPAGTTRKQVLGNPAMLTDLVQQQMATDWSEQSNFAATFGVSGHGLSGVPGFTGSQGLPLEGAGTMNGWLTQLYLALKNNTYVHSAKVTFDPLAWVVGKCLWMRVGDQATKFSFSDYNTVALLLEALCNKLNDVKKVPALIKRIFQATYDTAANALYVAVLDPRDIAKIVFVLNDCSAPDWECESQTGFTVENMQNGTEVITAPTAFPFESIGACGGIEYVKSFISTYYMSALENDRRLAANAVVLIDPMIVMNLGLNMWDTQYAKTGDPSMAMINNSQAILNKLALPITTYAVPSFIGTGAIIIAPRGGLRIATDEENSIQGYLDSGVSDPRTGCVFAKMEGFFNIFIQNPGDWYGNFCGLPFFNYLDTLDVRVDDIVKRNCFCPQEFMQNCIQTYSPSCNDLYREVTENKSILLSYNEGTNEVTMSYALPVPSDIDEFVWSVTDTAGGATAAVSAGATHVFTFASSIEGYQLQFNMTIKTTGCPDGIAKSVVVKILDGELIPITPYNQ